MELIVGETAQYGASALLSSRAGRPEGLHYQSRAAAVRFSFIMFWLSMV
jgi:hypothetical protein